MKQLFFLLISILVQQLAHTQVPGIIVKAINKEAYFKVEAQSRSSWTISPEVNPDIFTVPYKRGNKVHVKFITDIDSINFTLTNKDSLDFIVLLNERDSAYTRVKAVEYDDPVYFSKKYIRKNKGKSFVEIPAVHELFHIATSLTSSVTGGQKDIARTIDTSSSYYREVMRQFLPFKDHPFVKRLETYYSGRQAMQWYVNFNMNSYCFVVKDDRIAKSRTYNMLAGNYHNDLEPFLAEMQQFADESGFFKFYKDHQSYYKTLIDEYLKYIPVQKQVDWLNQRFMANYGSYRIITSSLIGGIHSTNAFTSNNFKEAFMFVATPITRPQFKEQVNIGLNTRVVFTEIDHNYVNPVSDKYITMFDSSIPVDKWATKQATQYYQNSYKVFNEYMTWAVFNLYSYDNFDMEAANLIDQETNTFMTNRGFTRYKTFKDKLLELYKASRSKRIDELFLPMLDWCALQL